MKINYKKLILITLLFILIIIYTMFFSHCQGDEVWAYGFGYNIAKGLIPYRDFNMIITPLYPIIASIFIRIFGEYIFSIHIFNAITFILIIWLLYKLIGNKTIIIIPLLLSFFWPTYNNFLVFLFILLIYIKGKEQNKEIEIILSSLIISAIFLTKQSIGIIFFLLELFLTKNKKKYLLVFLAPIITTFIYLIATGSLYNFIDYTFLGLFSFANKNSNLSIPLILTIFMCVFLIITYMKTKNTSNLYGLAFMSMSAPIFDLYHFQISFAIFIFILFLNINFSKEKYKYFIIWSLLWSVLMLYTFNSLYDNEIIIKDNNFLLGRTFEKEAIITAYKTSEIIDKYKNDYDKTYLFTGPNTYLLKLLRNERINKYDIINNGNMGIGGHEKYIKEVDNYCKKNKCLIVIVPYDEDDKYDQFNHQIIDYVLDNYKLLEENEYFYFYSN